MSSYSAITVKVDVWTHAFSADELAEIQALASNFGGEVDLERSSHETVYVIMPETTVDQFCEHAEALDNVSSAFPEHDSGVVVDEDDDGMASK